MWLGLAAAPVAAAVPGLSLSWEAPAGCPSQAAVESAVLAVRLDRAATDIQPVDARVIVERSEERTWRAHLTTRFADGQGSRELEGESCAAIASATAVVLALALDPSSEGGQAPEAPPAPKASPLPVPAEPAEPAEPARIFYLHGFTGGVLGALPRPSPSFGLGAGARSGPWDVELLLSLSLEQIARVRQPPGATASIGLLRAQGLACLSPVRSEQVVLEVCGGALVERFSGSSSGISHPAPQSRTVLSPQLGLRSRLRLSPRLQLVLDVAATARPRRPRFVIGGVGQVHEIPMLDAMFSVGPELSL